MSQRTIGLNREWFTSVLESMNKEFLVCLLVMRKLVREP